MSKVGRENVPSGQGLAQGLSAAELQRAAARNQLLGVGGVGADEVMDMQEEAEAASILLSATEMRDLEPEVHKVIKKMLGFSEPTLLAAALSSIQAGASEEQLTKRLCTLVERTKAMKLSNRIVEALEDFCLSRDLQGTVVKRKHPARTQVDDENTGWSKLAVHQTTVAKKATEKEEGGKPAAAAGQDKSAMTMGNVAMTTEQIRAMMANARRELEDRKRSLEQLALRDRIEGQSRQTSSFQLNTAQPLAGGAAPLPLTGANSVPIAGAVPVPKVNHLAQSAEDKAKTIAALQAQIASRMEKVVAGMKPEPKPEAADGANAAQDRPTTLILDAQGRTVDASGQEITLAQHVPTLKANLRAKKRDEMKEHLRDAGGSGAAAREDVAFNDARIAIKGTVRNKRSIRFVDPGKYAAEGNRMRMKAQLEKLQADISTIARKTGIQSATQMAKLVSKGGERDRIPDVEWWDQLILKLPTYTNPHIKMDAITNLIEHPLQLKQLESTQGKVHVPVFLTAKERKKIRRQNRREAWKEKQDKIRLGLVDPDQPKVKITNLMRVLGTEAVQDPTKVEASVRAQMAKRLAEHEKANAERKLTPEQRKDKNMGKLKEDTSAGVHVAVYRLRNLSNLSKKFKIETNARQLFMTGCVVMYEDVNVVVVEGGPKQQKKYRQLMTKRIRWDEETYKDKDGMETENKCTIIWEGQVKERAFGELKFKLCPTESFAREHFKKAGTEHYWDQAYSCAVLESTNKF